MATMKYVTTPNNLKKAAKQANAAAKKATSGEKPLPKELKFKTAEVKHGRYRIDRIPAGEHKVEAAIVMKSPYGITYLRLDNGRIYYTNASSRDLVLDSDFFSAKDLSAIYKLGGPAPAVIRKLRAEEDKKRLASEMESLNDELMDAARRLGYISFTNKAGKVVKVTGHGTPKVKKKAKGN